MSLSDRVVDHLRSVADEPDLSETKYRVIRTIGRGGMGAIWLVEDRELRRQVAMKVLDPPDTNGELSARLFAEAWLLAGLEHPNIIPIHDAGVLADGRVFYVMKLVRGKRLDEWVREGPSRAARLRLFGKICEAIAFAHAHGVIHRDLKPGNVMVGPFGEALVMDWGIARTVGPAQPTGIAPSSRAVASPASDAVIDASSPERGATPARARSGDGSAREEPPSSSPAGMPGGETPHDATRTVDGTVLGTPGWMAPEQARGETSLVDVRADIWSLGAVLYFLLCGAPPGSESHGRERPFASNGAASPSPVRRVDRSIPKALGAICAKAMDSDRARRYATALDLAQDVERFLGAEPVAAYREGLLERTRRLASRNAALLWLIAAYLLMRVLVELFRR